MKVIRLLTKELTHTHYKTKTQVGMILTVLEPLESWCLSQIYLDIFCISFSKISCIELHFYC